jgi:hypothetical protein
MTQELFNNSVDPARHYSEINYWLCTKYNYLRDVVHIELYLRRRRSYPIFMLLSCQYVTSLSFLTVNLLRGGGNASKIIHAIRKIPICSYTTFVSRFFVWLFATCDGSAGGVIWLVSDSTSIRVNLIYFTIFNCINYVNVYNSSMS